MTVQADAAVTRDEGELVGDGAGTSNKIIYEQPSSFDYESCDALVEGPKE